ncbi:DUF4249 domain-containing protein [Persicitalea sp.]|uniref:DUF4249 domain-containing protein n=1 Tax=Persicitalea sp. TaxID=3100273 RepID=UPI003592F31F
MKYFAFLLLIVLTSCESLVNTIPEDKLPQGDPQLTMFCYISPQDTVIRAKVSRSRPAFGMYSSNGQSYFLENGDTIRTNQPLTTATVTISDGQTTANLRYQKPNQVFDLPVSQFPIRAGQTYTLTVTEGGQKAQATCTVPKDQVPVKSYTLDSMIGNRFGNTQKILTTNFTWDDPAGEANYYRVNVYEVIDAPAFRFNQAEKKYYEYRQTFINNYRVDRNNFRSVFQNDKNLDGTTFASPQFESYSSLLNYGGGITVDGKPLLPSRPAERVGIYLQVQNVDVPYYEFHRSLENYNGDNPFTEPSLIYTNVKGGLGVFASYNQSTKAIKP